MKIARSVCIACALLPLGGFGATEEDDPGGPRATSGEAVLEPAWDERLTVTVGPSNAEVVGATDRALQAAVDYAARLGGGTVRVGPGTYRMRNAIRLQSGVRLEGSGAASVLIKEPSVTVRLASNADWWDQEITLADASGFRIGDGVCLWAKSAAGVETVLCRTLIARRGNVFKLDRALRLDFPTTGGAAASSLFSILDGENVADVTIENLTLDGNRSRNSYLDGNYGAGIFLQDCNRISLRGVTVRNYNGDGISWQICHDVVVENCRTENNACRGMHPGSASHRTIVRHNRIVGNSIGIYFCAGVRYGRAEDNVVADNGIGISIGYRDTDNLVVANEVSGSREAGVRFRPAGERAFSGNHNRIERNRIVNSGGAKGVAIDVQGSTEGVVLADNQIIETRGPAQRVGVALGPETRDIQLRNNTIKGVSVAVRQ